MIYEIEGKQFWLDEVADSFLRYMKDNNFPTDTTITLAAGMTPSCPIHFGIFREILITWFVAEELKNRGFDIRVVYFWDDFDHFCKVPYFTNSDSVREHLGKPLCEVPDLNGDYDSYSKHYMDIFEKDLTKLGIFPDYNYQSEKYRSGEFTNNLILTLKKRFEIFDIINERLQPYSEEIKKEREHFYPVEVYCANCRRYGVKTQEYNETTDVLQYLCKNCGHQGSYIMSKNFSGKLMWKANWATRWIQDTIFFESSGENQLTDTGSYAVASKISEQIYKRPAPFSLLYRFVGAPGVAKVSRALGEKVLSTKLTDLLEPAIIRWLFLRNSPQKPFSIDIEKNLIRIYHEWDLFLQKNIDGEITQTEKRIFFEATKNIEYCPIPISFRTILTAIGIANGNMLKTASFLYKTQQIPAGEDELYRMIRPRLGCAYKYIFQYQNTQDSPILLTEMNKAAYNEISEQSSSALKKLAIAIKDCISEDEIGLVLRSIPDELDPTGNLRKELYRNLYLLLIGQEKGPKLSTLIYLAGSENVTRLIMGEKVYE